LGAYGNTTSATPALDQFAAESLLLDSCIAPAADLGDIYHALWYGEHPARARGASAARRESAFQALPALLAGIGYHATLVTDEPELLQSAAAAGFQNQISVESSLLGTGSSTRANDVLDTALARVFLAANDAMVDAQARESARRDSTPTDLVWVHARGMYGPWDAPIDLQESLLDADDPAPVDSIAPPDLQLGERDDPDTVFRYSCAYTAQVLALDSLWQGLAESIFATQPRAPWLVMLLGARGCPLGEHRQIGGTDERLYIEQLHVPWLIRYPHEQGKLLRTSNLVTHADVLPTILGWAEVEQLKYSSSGDGLNVGVLVEDGRADWRDALLSTSKNGNRAIRSASWSLLEHSLADMQTASSPTVENERSAELYVRPDDRWEANDVAKLCSEVVEQHRSTADKAMGCCAAGQPFPQKLLDIESEETE
jgi:arylsulfatase A-like enzyme